MKVRPRGPRWGSTRLRGDLANLGHEIGRGAGSVWRSVDFGVLILRVQNTGPADSTANPYQLMTNNDTLRRLRYALNLNNTQVANIITRIGKETSPAQVERWLKREDEDGVVEVSDATLCRFLDGLIIEKRGPRPDGSIPEALEFLSNNEVLKKLRIALELRDDDMSAVFEQAEFVVTKAELGSFFRKEGHRQYRPCPEQVLRKFLLGLSKKSE